MKLLVHDLNEQEFGDLLPSNREDIIIISNDQRIHPCIGCFGCWIKTPIACVIKDRYQNIGKLISQCEELILISKCCYGGFSPFVKNVLDRSIAYIHPYFTLRGGEMHHKNRYEEQFKLTVRFYGKDITAEEKNTAVKLVPANGLNLNVKEHAVYFYDNIEEMRGKLI